MHVLGVAQDGSILAASRMAEALFGYEDLVGCSVHDLVPPASRARHRELTDGYVMAPHPRPMADYQTLRAVHANGSLLHVRIVLIPQDDITYAFLSDLTRFVEVENFCELSSDHMALVRHDGFIERANHAFLSLGHSKDDLSSTPFIGLFHQDDVDLVEERVQSTVHGETTSFSARIRCRDGSYKRMSWVAVPGPHGTFHSAGRDMTALERANIDLEQFAYAASHDLQEPLRAVGGFVTLIDKKYRSQVDAQGQFYFERTVAAVERLKQLINDLLAFSRAGAGEVEDVSVHDSFKDAVSNLCVSIGEAGAIVRWSGPDAKVSINRSQLVSVFQNLIGNAIKFYGGPSSSTVDVVCSSSEDAVLVSVSDNGPGVPQRYVGKLFQVFNRFHDSTISGTGIGLAIVKRAVERAGGSIWYSQSDSGGAKFTFSMRPA